MKLPKEKGFTLIEMSVVLAFGAIVVVASFAFFKGAQERAAITEARSTIVSELEKARGRALTGAGSGDQGVRVEEDRLIILEVGTSSTTSVGTVWLPPLAKTNQTGLDVVFTRLSGISSASTTISVTAGNSTTSISVSFDGYISSQD